MSSFPPDSSPLATGPSPELPMAVACPACFGAIAVPADLWGGAAECPLCSTGFRVPQPAAAGLIRPPIADASTGRGRPAAPRQKAAATARSQPAPSPAIDGSTAAIPASEPLPEEMTPATEPLAFREPVRTVVSGDRVIEIRRLSPQERSARRTRRSLVMMIGGVSILMAIVLMLGTKRRKRRS